MIVLIQLSTELGRIHLHQKWDLPGLPEWEPSKMGLQIKHQSGVQIPKNMSFRVKTVIVLVQCRKYVQYIFHVSHFVAGISEPGGVLKIVMVWV